MGVFTRSVSRCYNNSTRQKGIGFYVFPEESSPRKECLKQVKRAVEERQEKAFLDLFRYLIHNLYSPHCTITKECKLTQGMRRSRAYQSVPYVGIFQSTRSVAVYRNFHTALRRPFLIQCLVDAFWWLQLLLIRHVLSTTVLQKISTITEERAAILGMYIYITWNKTTFSISDLIFFSGLLCHNLILLALLIHSVLTPIDTAEKSILRRSALTVRSLSKPNKIE